MSAWLEALEETCADLLFSASPLKVACAGVSTAPVLAVKQPPLAYIKEPTSLTPSKRGRTLTSSSSEKLIPTTKKRARTSLSPSTASVSQADPPLDVTAVSARASTSRGTKRKLGPLAITCAKKRSPAVSTGPGSAEPPIATVILEHPAYDEVAARDNQTGNVVRARSHSTYARDDEQTDDEAHIARHGHCPKLAQGMFCWPRREACQTM